MRLLLDTHAFIWWFLDQPELPVSARRRIVAAGNGTYVSVVSAWEIALKHRRGKLPGVAEMLGNFRSYCEDFDFAILPVELDHALASASLPEIHRDPFDRLLIAQARTEGMALVSRDAVVAHYDVDVVW